MSETTVKIQYARCERCMFGVHYEPVETHPWAGAEDIEHAKLTGQPKPEGDCACWCSGGDGPCRYVNVGKEPGQVDPATLDALKRALRTLGPAGHGEEASGD